MWSAGKRSQYRQLLANTVMLVDSLKVTMQYLQKQLDAADAGVGAGTNGGVNGGVNGGANGGVNGGANGGANGGVNGGANGGANGGKKERRGGVVGGG